MRRGGMRPKWLRRLLEGTWLGHSLHPLLTDVPIGALTIALILDLLGIYEGANVATLLGSAGLVLAAIAGVVDLDETDGKARQYGGVHPSLILVPMVSYAFSLLLPYGYAPRETCQCVLLAAFGYAFVV